ncbi:MAG TPA: CBS domain-containing protein [Gemmatimonadaceae bacterium]|jgi:CBS domain-containing protein|nr:CBS domain-containing protein [Gemmatimonadaceae bacterium]
MLARELMTPNPSVITADDTMLKAAQMMRDNNVGMLPVVDTVKNRKLVGVITDRDIVVRCVAEHHTPDCRVQAHMTSESLDAVGLDTDVKDVVTHMERDQVRRIPVLEDGGRVAGVIAQADVAVRLGPTNAKIVEELVERISSPGALTF